MRVERQAPTRPRDRAGYALLVSWTLALSSCGGLLPSRGADGEQELRRRVIDLERKAIVAEVEIDRLRQKVAALEATRPAAVPRLPPAAVVSAPAVEPRVAPAPAIQSGDLPDEEVSTEPAGPIGATVAPPLPVGTLEPAPPEARTAYDRAFVLFNQGLFAEAEVAFRAYLEAYRSNELSDNAVYWIGESRLARSDWNGALRWFQDVIERFPTGNKVPDALYKAGQALERLGDVDSARASYQMLLERFPDSGAGALARDRLALLPAS